MFKRFTQFIFILPLILFLTSCSSSQWVQGKWEGTGYQIDGHTWEVVLDARDMENIKIDYPDLACGGDWTTTKKTRKELEFKEKITFGTLICDQGNEVFVNKSGKNSIHVVYYLRSYDPINPIAEATLRPYMDK